LVLEAFPKLNEEGVEDEAFPKPNVFEAGCDVAPNIGVAAGLTPKGFGGVADVDEGAAPKLKEKGLL